MLEIDTVNWCVLKANSISCPVGALHGLAVTLLIVEEVLYEHSAAGAGCG
jgi:hypothetical protein